MPAENSRRKIVIVGGSNAGMSAAARLISAGEKDVARCDIGARLEHEVVEVNRPRGKWLW